MSEPQEVIEASCPKVMITPVKESMLESVPAYASPEGDGVLRGMQRALNVQVKKDFYRLGYSKMSAEECEQLAIDRIRAGKTAWLRPRDYSNNVLRILDIGSSPIASDPRNFTIIPHGMRIITRLLHIPWYVEMENRVYQGLHVPFFRFTVAALTQESCSLPIIDQVWIKTEGVDTPWSSNYMFAFRSAWKASVPVGLPKEIAVQAAIGVYFKNVQRLIYRYFAQEVTARALPKPTVIDRGLRPYTSRRRYIGNSETIDSATASTSTTTATTTTTTTTTSTASSARATKKVSSVAVPVAHEGTTKETVEDVSDVMAAGDTEESDEELVPSLLKRKRVAAGGARVACSKAEAVKEDGEGAGRPAKRTKDAAGDSAASSQGGFVIDLTRSSLEDTEDVTGNIVQSVAPIETSSAYRVLSPNRIDAFWMTPLSISEHAYPMTELYIQNGACAPLATAVVSYNIPVSVTTRTFAEMEETIASFEMGHLSLSLTLRIDKSIDKTDPRCKKYIHASIDMRPLAPGAPGLPDPKDAAGNDVFDSEWFSTAPFLPLSATNFAMSPTGVPRVTQYSLPMKTRAVNNAITGSYTAKLDLGLVVLGLCVRYPCVIAMNAHVSRKIARLTLNLQSS